MLPLDYGRAAGEGKARPELADIFRSHGESYRRTHCLPASHRKVMRAVEVCRTKELGGHLKQCDTCGFEHPAYNSCRNRHCPKCQSLAKAKWLKKQTAELLPVGYFHLVFTLPHGLNLLILANKRALLNILFQAVSKTLLEFGHTHLRGTVGFIAVLHTWDQTLKDHFHLHCLIPAGALSPDQSRWIKARKNFLFRVEPLSRVFRGKFLYLMKKAIRQGKLPSPAPRLSNTDWVVYAKKPFASPQQVLDYLGRYTHRVAISNNRILCAKDGEVTFTYRDRKDNDRKKTLTLPAEQFIGRFLLHVLPEGFMPACACRTQTGASVTSAFSPTEPRSTLSLNAVSFWDFIPSCLKSLSHQSKILCENLPALISPAARPAKRERCWLWPNSPSGAHGTPHEKDSTALKLV